MAHPWFTLQLIHAKAEACSAFSTRFAGLPGVEVQQMRYEDLGNHACFVTAGNAYGLMMTGNDAAVIHRLGRAFVREVQEHIMDVYFGEQPIGTAFVIATRDAGRPYLCHAPTMRTRCSIVRTSHIYSATFAALVAIHRHNLAHHATPNAIIDRVVMPAMGTGFGSMSFSEAARQMSVAYRHYLRPPGRPNWGSIIARERAICYDGDQKVVRI